MTHAARTFHAPAKVNLFLEVAGRRADGFHNLVTVMASISLGDDLHVTSGLELVVTADRADVPNGETNLAHRIVRAAEAELGQPLPARIHIQKRLPPGSGLGAGSSDAAAALRAVLELHALQVPTDQAESIAARVGSDTSFFVRGVPALCTGRGEIVSPIPAPLPAWIVLVLGAPPAPTKDVYAALRRDGAPRSADAILARLASGDPLTDEMIFNRLEEAALTRFPALREIRAQLASVTGRTPHLSGSGSAFFFLTESPKDAAILADVVRNQTAFEPLMARTLTSNEEEF